MIPRRVAEHLKNRDWLAVFIDFAIVVASVFIGMQASNWNDERAARQRGAEFSARLLEDLRADALAYQNQIDYYTTVRRNAEAAVAALGGTAPATDDALLVSAYRASQYIYFNRHRAVYDELVSTGAIGLVADRELRETAVLLYTTSMMEEVREAALKAEYRRVFRRTVPAEVQRELLAKCGDRGSNQTGWTIDYACTLDLPPDLLRRAAEALRGEPSVLAALQLRFADVETAVFNLERGEGELRARLQKLSAPPGELK